MDAYLLGESEAKMNEMGFLAEEMFALFAHRNNFIAHSTRTSMRTWIRWRKEKCDV